MMGSIFGKVDTFKSDQKGSVALMFGLTGIAMCLFVGMGVDMGRTIASRTKVAAAADAAALAAAKGLRLEGLNQSEAIALARRVFDENLKAAGGNWTEIRDVRVTIDSITGAAKVDVDAFVKTAFVAVAGVPEMAVIKSATAMFDSKNVEVGLQVDLTGSMCMPCSKLADLKQATRDLVDILIPDTSSTQTVRIGLAPFSAGINAGSYLLDVNGNRVSASSCVYERQTSTNEATDAAPSGSDAFKIRSDLTGAVQGCPGSELMPLTSDRSALTDAVQAFTTGASTAGQLGAAWAWYLVSPNWSSIWPSVSRPVGYSDERTDKVVILMTDGVYNTIGGINYGDTSSQAQTASAMSVQVCGNMKAAGVKVYTVGFDLDSIADSTARQRATDTLTACASNASNFFKADDGDQLRAAFRAIANNILTLRLSN
jgi:Flp pilus assembly protein TadG